MLFFRGQFQRASFAFTGGFLFITGVSFLPLADAIAITFAGPLFITALAGPMLGEPVGWRRWAAVGVGFIGVMVIVRPSGEALQLIRYLKISLGRAFCRASRARMAFLSPRLAERSIHM